MTHDIDLWRKNPGNEMIGVVLDGRLLKIMALGDDGQVHPRDDGGGMRPVEFACGASHLPRLADAIYCALVEARVRGLVGWT